MSEEFGYENQPYVAELMKFISANPTLKPGLHHIQIGHDEWCPLLLGTGPCICLPVVCSPNRKERRATKKRAKRKDS